MKIPTAKLSMPSTANATNAKLPSFKMPKPPSIKIGQPKIPIRSANPKFNFGKFSKQPKIPKEKQLKVLKTAISKSKKNAGF